MDVAWPYNMDATKYMRLQESWWHMPAKILLADFYQLPPVPAASPLLAPGANQTYEHPQGRKLLAAVERVLDFVEMNQIRRQPPGGSLGIYAGTWWQTDLRQCLGIHLEDINQVDPRSLRPTTFGSPELVRICI